ncbi:adenine DNA glycosylase isoform X2 [Ziziphus jujuba]|uniref:Adenine DNA glycosylase n=1 Tax=Ziziphus jujuba TaxID=326968 RepID=A0ABM4A6Y0_ZIZJJ|nr:adenine DNA glycosylase isoform X2 [Ziziphus jujuba]
MLATLLMGTFHFNPTTTLFLSHNNFKFPPVPFSGKLSPSDHRRRRMSRRKAAGERSRKVPELRKPPETVAEDIEDLFGDAEIKRIRDSLLGWYALNRRELPWREPEEDKEKRAYRVWVSEVMLQQTRVQTVVQYFDRWMNKWPTIRHLADASLEEVNEMWAGLGYYRRARFLLEGAKMIVAEGCPFPKTVSSLQQYPGIGKYTAGAVASIAFKEVVPVVDGNVVRVISRLKAISANPKDSATVKRFWELATQLVDPLNPGDFNQALMELGATVCTPSSPSCCSCPVSDQCSALSVSRHDSSVSVTDYPVKVVKVKQRHDFSAACVVEILGEKEICDGHLADSKFLLVKRPDEGLLAGLWEFPSVLLNGEADLVDRKEAIDQFLNEHVGEFVHVFSHIRLKIYVELLTLRLKGGIDLFRKQEKESLPWKCVDSKVLSSLGLTSSVKKVYTMVEKFKQQKPSNNSVPAKKRNRIS